MLKKNLVIDTPYQHLTNDTKKIKDWYGIDFAKVFTSEIAKCTKKIDLKNFLKEFKKEYQKLELKDRLKLIALQLHNNLDLTYENKIKILTKILGPKWPHEIGMMNYGFFLYPVSQYIEMYGDKKPEISLNFIKELTQRFTGEFAIRPLLVNEPTQTLKKMKEWSHHKSFHVRRLSSEGLRARLPWGQGVPWIKNNPQKTIPIFNRLRNDTSLYVRRSVANAMGDIIKLDSDLAMSTFDKWLSGKINSENIWVIKHAIRNPVKKKNPEYLKLKKHLLSLEANVLSN